MKWRDLVTRLVGRGGGRIPVDPPKRQTQIIEQKLLLAQYAASATKREPLPAWRDAGFSIYSQDDEDGLLLLILGVIGTKSRRCVEICAGSAMECNTTNLILAHAFDGLLLDGNRQLVERGRAFFKTERASQLWPPRYEVAWVTRESINHDLRRFGFEGDVDVLSLDVDGMEFWLWDALEAIRPRVVVVEYQDIAGPGRSITVPYDPKFSAVGHPSTDGLPNYAGASLLALARLGARRGYRLVGTNRCGFNAFFVAESECSVGLSTVSVDDCFGHPKTVWGMAERWPTVAGLPWTTVE
jgi:hypothetical protein